MQFPNAQTFWTHKSHHPNLQQSFLNFYLSANFKKILNPTPFKSPYKHSLIYAVMWERIKKRGKQKLRKSRLLSSTREEENRIEL